MRTQTRTATLIMHWLLLAWHSLMQLLVMTRSSSGRKTSSPGGFGCGCKRSGNSKGWKVLHPDSATKAWPLLLICWASKTIAQRCLTSFSRWSVLCSTKAPVNSRHCEGIFLAFSHRRCHQIVSAKMGISPQCSGSGIADHKKLNNAKAQTPKRNPHNSSGNLKYRISAMAMMKSVSNMDGRLAHGCTI